jgi:hypothetical protein
MPHFSLFRYLLLSLVATGAVFSAAPSCEAAEPRVDLDPRWVHPTAAGERPKTLFSWSVGAGEETGGPAGPDEPLISDRPDFTEASATVGRGVLQVEMGYTYSRDKDGGDIFEAHSYPETLFRLGVGAEWFELRLAYNHGTQRLSTAGGPFASTTGAEDLYLGAKLGLTMQRGIFPEMALVPQMTVPTGHSAFTADDSLPGANWLYGWDITENIGTGGSTQINKSIDDDGTRYYEVAQSWTVNFALTDRLGTYTEWFMFAPSGASGAKPQYYFDGGFTFSVNNDLQLDVRGGAGLNGAATDYFLGSGLVKRF